MRSNYAIISLALSLFLLGCPIDDIDDDDITGDDDSAPVDADQDGFHEGVDCDDHDPQTWPGAPELCDGLDNDCDGNVPGDEVDADGDSYLACAECDDGEDMVYPSAPELCDGLDNDCDGSVPDDEQDGDGDGVLECEDCDDTDASIHPGAIEVACDYIDNDCDGALHGDEMDDDGDGYDECEGDWDDSEAAVYPGAEEICDGLDNDGDGVVDSGLCGTFDLSTAHAKLVGETNIDHAGYSVSSAGDVNGDGYHDLLVGAPGQGTGGNMAGAAYLVHGPISGTLDLSAAAAKLVGEEENDDAGWSVSTAGDIDADGYDDILVGAPYHGAGGSGTGAAYLMLGPVAGTVDLAAADAKLQGELVNDWAGLSVSSAGDVNGDGYDDLLVGTSAQPTGGFAAGAAYVVNGPVLGTVDLANAAAKFVGEADDDYAGFSVSSAGDVNGDGYDDIFVGAQYQDEGGNDAGAAYLMLGAP